MSKERFFNSLKDFLIRQVKNETNLTLQEICRYFETIKQHEEKLTYLFEDIERYAFDLRYEEDETGGYTNGSVMIFFHSNGEEPFSTVNHHYKVEFLYDDRYWRYCQCRPEDEGYNEAKHCCGDGCDWSAPRVSIEKIENKSHFSFDGYEKDMWALETSWAKDVENFEEEEKQKKLKWLDERILDLQLQKERLLNK